MSLYLPLGKNSADEIFQIELTQLSHLFISYCHEEQINDFFAQFSNTVISSCLQQPVQLAIASTRAHFIPAVAVNDHLFRYRYIANNERESNVTSRGAFLQQVFKELSKRQNQLKKNNAATLFTPLFVLLHDVFDMILLQPKSAGLQFLKLLLDGPQVNIHLIGASTLTYHNLVKQLIHLNPLVALKFKDQTSRAVASRATALADELVLNAEGFVYYCGSNEPTMQRLYPLRNTISCKQPPVVLEQEALPALQLRFAD